MKRWICLIVVQCLLFMSGCSEGNSLQSTAKNNIASSTKVIKDNKEYYPTDVWRTSAPEEQGVDSQNLYDLIKSIKVNKLAIDSLLIIRNGYIITEKYFQPGNKENIHELQSVTKSFTSALVGIAINDGHIKSVNEKALDYFSDRRIQNNDVMKKQITVKNLLTMTAGFKWDMFPSDSPEYTGNEMYMSYDPIQYILNRPMSDEPGKTFIYNSGASQLLAEIVQKTSGVSLKSYADDKLFKPLGITKYYWDTTMNGKTLSGFDGLYLTTRDMAKFGYLYLQKGKWGEKQLIPQKWVHESTKKQVDNSPYMDNSGYGYQWWINSFGGYSARGRHGQYIIVMPELNMVVVFQSSFDESDDYDDMIPLGLMENEIIPAVKSSQPLPANDKAFNMLKSVCSK